MRYILFDALSYLCDLATNILLYDNFCLFVKSLICGIEMEPGI